jgi:hypothetical protein
MQRTGLCRTASAIVVPLLAAAFVACGTMPGASGRAPIRISEVVEEGDYTRRASVRLLVEGLEADASGAQARAKGRYERAIQIDPTNPYAYLVFARFEVDRRRAEPAHAFLDQAVALFEAVGGTPPRVEPHVVGLNGAIEMIFGNSAVGSRELRRAREMAPEVWGDGYLTAEELL